MATVYEIIQGINQAAANAHDGAHDEKYSYDGKARKVGLKREEGDCIIDSRVMDGFKVKIHGDKLVLNYQSEITLKDFHNRNFEDDVEDTFNDIVKYLKKEYKSVTKNTLTLTSQGDADIHAQSMSRKRNWVQATKTYKIGNMGETEPVTEESSEDRLDDAVKKWLALSGENAKKPQNVSIKG